MIVVKIGGSLYSSPHLQEWADDLASVRQQSIVIVPGGGPFTKQVRDADAKWNLTDDIAHHMAVLGMQQFGYLLTSLNANITPAESLTDIAKNGVYVWLPSIDIRADCNYPNNWQITSDSLALWLACQISADHLCLVKSAQINNKSAEQLVGSDLVDDYFSTAKDNFLGQIHFYHSSLSKKFMEDLHNEKFR